MQQLKQLHEMRDQLMTEIDSLHRRLQSIHAAISVFENGPTSGGSRKSGRISVNSHIIDAAEAELKKRGALMRSTELARILEAEGIKLRTERTSAQSHLASILSSKVTRGRIVHYRKGYGLPGWVKKTSSVASA